MLLDNSLLDISPLAPPAVDDAPALGADDSRYTHFSETFHSRRSSSMLPPSIAEGASAASQPASNTTTLSKKLKGYDKHKQRITSTAKQKKSTGGFGVSLKMVPTESSELLLRSPPSMNQAPDEHDYGMSQFYSFKKESSEYDATNEWERYAKTCQQMKRRQSGSGGEYDGGDEEERNTFSNMISFYSGRKDGYFSVPSPNTGSSRRQHDRHSRGSPNETSEGNFILSFLFGSPRVAETNNATTNPGTASRQHPGTAGGSAAHERTRNPRTTHGQTRAATRAARRKQVRLRRKRREHRRREHVPAHLRRAHLRAAAITERCV